MSGQSELVYVSDESPVSFARSLMNSTSLFFPCREDQISSNTTSPIVWGIEPDLQSARICVATIQALLLIIGVIWNLFILVSYCIKPKLLKEPANVYLFNLAVTDLLQSIFVIFSSFLTEVIGEFVFGSSDIIRCRYCLFLGIVLHTLILQSLHTLAVLSLDRFIFLYRPLKYKSMFNWKKAVAIQACLWVLCIGIAVLPTFGFGEYEFNLALATCIPRWTGQSQRGIDNINYVILYSTESLLPLFMLIFTNVLIIKIVRSFLKKKITRQRSFRGGNSKSSYEEEKRYQRQQQQLIRVFGALLVTHTVCWTPFLTTSFVAVGIGAARIPVGVYLFGWLALLFIPVLHPMVESFFIKDLRCHVQKLARAGSSCIWRAADWILRWQGYAVPSSPHSIITPEIRVFL